ncbi:MAG: methyltransferase domain-containing protein [Deltaproteobacteria bacterium]|nr:methyltransferase domain-containing protein [Deltaproteobacteria bacterium]
MNAKPTDRPQELLNPPAPFLVDSLHQLPRGKALDVAAGRGRNALYLAQHGFSVHALDRDPAALQTLQTLTGEQNIQNVTTEVVDLESGPVSESVFPASTYDVVLVFLYLFRSLFPALLRTLKPGGMIVYETFLVENHLRYHHPRHREFCFAAGELRTLVSELHILHYDEGERPRPDGQPGTFTVRLLAQKKTP